MKRLALIIAAASVAATTPAAASPVAQLSLTRTATPATNKAHLAGEWHGFPVWSLALGAVILSAVIVTTIFNTDPSDDFEQPDSN